MDATPPPSHSPEQIEVWREAGTVCGICGGTGVAQRTIEWWYHRAWQPPVDRRCWYCDGDGRLDPGEDAAGA